MQRGGHILFEIGSDQAGGIEAVFDATNGLELIEIVNDLSGLPRVAIAMAVD